MIISASRRTDISAFYIPWFMKRIREGYCTVPNPYNRKQVSLVSLAPSDCSVIVFWTRYAQPLLVHLPELDDRGYQYFFQYTLMANPRWLEPKRPVFTKAAETFLRLSDHVGPDRMIWRYDPIVLGSAMDTEYHLNTFYRIAELLKGATRKCVISIVDIYRRNQSRMRGCCDDSKNQTAFLHDDHARLFKGLAEIAREQGLGLNSCAGKIDLSPCGIPSGKCIDDKYIARVFGIKVSGRKDPSQRKACNCVVSRDIGSYDTCLFGCRYCYATSSFKLAAKNYAGHNPDSPSLLGWHEAPLPG